MNIKLESATVYDPINKISNLKKDIYISDGKIVNRLEIKGTILIDSNHPKNKHPHQISIISILYRQQTHNKNKMERHFVICSPIL